jgi:hypothetical protein
MKDLPHALQRTTRYHSPETQVLEGSEEVSAIGKHSNRTTRQNPKGPPLEGSPSPSGDSRVCRQSPGSTSLRLAVSGFHGVLNHGAARAGNPNPTVLETGGEFAATLVLVYEGPQARRAGQASRGSLSASVGVEGAEGVLIALQ